MDYRLYRLDGASRIVGTAEVISAADDANALAQARDAGGSAHGELWQGGRLVGRVDLETMPEIALPSPPDESVFDD